MDHFVEKMDPYMKKPLTKMTLEESFRYLSDPDYEAKEFDKILHYEYSHIFIPHSLFGLVGLLAPFSNYVQT